MRNGAGFLYHIPLSPILTPVFAILVPDRLPEGT